MLPLKQLSGYVAHTAHQTLQSLAIKIHLFVSRGHTALLQALQLAKSARPEHHQALTGQQLAHRAQLAPHHHPAGQLVLRAMLLLSQACHLPHIARVLLQWM